MAKKELPEALRLKHARDRKETQDKIEDSAKALRDEGRSITRQNLIKVSGLAPSTFSKNHVKAYLLKRWAIGADEVAATELPSLDQLDEKEFGEILKKVDDLRKRLVSTEDKLEKERDMRKKAEAKLDDRDEEIKILRGELDIALRRVRILSATKKKGELIKLFKDAEESDT